MIASSAPSSSPNFEGFPSASLSASSSVASLSASSSVAPSSLSSSLSSSSLAADSLSSRLEEGDSPIDSSSKSSSSFSPLFVPSTLDAQPVLSSSALPSDVITQPDPTGCDRSSPPPPTGRDGPPAAPRRVGFSDVITIEELVETGSASSAEEEEEGEDEPPGLIDEEDDEEDAPDVAATSTEVPMPRSYYLGGEGRKGRKYYLTGKVNGSLFHQICDTAADLSVIPKHLVSKLGLQEFPLDTPIQVNGFQGSSSPEMKITSKCRVITDLGQGVELPVEYHVACIDTPYALLGTDVLGDSISAIHFQSSTGVMQIDGLHFLTKRSTVASTVEFHRRCKMKKKDFHRQYQVNFGPFMKSSRRVVIRPFTVTWIDAHITGDVSQYHTFLSDFPSMFLTLLHFLSHF